MHFPYASIDTSLIPRAHKQSTNLADAKATGDGLTSASPSPTSSTSSFLSLFDSPSLPLGLHCDPFDRRESASSATNWDSMEGSLSSKPPDDISMEDASSSDSKRSINDFALSPNIPYNTRMSSNGSIKTVSSSGSSASDPSLATPDLMQEDRFPSSSLPTPPQSSPSGSTTSTAPSKGESTPRAEIPPPVWPLSSTTPSSVSVSPRSHHDYYAEPYAMTDSEASTSQDTPMSRKSSLKRGGSWRRKHASLDTPPNAPRLDPGFPGFTALKNTPPLAQSVSPPPQRPVASGETRLAPPSSETNPPDVRRLSGESFQSIGSGNSIIAQSLTTGCEISAPKAPPAGYPLPSLAGLQRRFSGPDKLQSSPAANTASSSPFSKNSKKSIPTPPPPKWACPPTKTNAVSGRALSFGSSQERPDVNFDDFDPELFEGAENEWIEIIKGAEGRIAIKSTPSLYDIMVWLPGFSLDNITIATRGHRTIHIVADQWDEGDHAQWDIKLGEDANLKSVNAKFTGKELRVTVAREQRYQSSNRTRLPSNRPSMNGSYSSPSITSSSGHSPLERATVTR